MIATSPVDCARSYRIIPSRFPPIDLFERVADPVDLSATLAAEALTNPRLRQEMGELDLVPTADRISGPGTSPIMAAFTHPNPDGSRFSDGSYGVYYAGMDKETAIRETVFHRERLLRFHPKIIEQTVSMRTYIGRVHGDFVDIRDLGETDPIYSPDRYDASQGFGGDRRSDNHWGIVYRSVRHPDGYCLAVFRPPACKPVIQGTHYDYHYRDGRIREVVELKKVGLDLETP